MTTLEQAPAPACAAPASAFRLTVPRADAVRVVRAQLERGMEIKKARIRYVADLEKARVAKGEWVARTSEILRKVFVTSQVADECHAWSGRVLPEYAELSLFIELFYDEMDQRLGRLQSVVRKLQELPESATGGRSVATVSAVPAVAAALPAPGAAPLAPPPGTPAHPGPISPVQIGAVLEAAPAPAKIIEANGITMEMSEATMSESAAVEEALPPVGMLVTFTTDAQAVHAVEQFTGKLGFAMHMVAADGADAPANLSERLEGCSDSQFAIFLLNGASEPSPFHLGFCAGRLGARRVFLLSTGEARAGVDAHGIARTPLDPADGWQLQLARHLRRAGLEVDLNRVL